MKMMMTASLSLAVLGLAGARADDARVRPIAPFVSDDVFAVGRLDLTKADPGKIARRLVANPEEAEEATSALTPWFEAIRKAGAKEVFVLGILPEILGNSPAKMPVVVPLVPGADAKAIGEALCGGGAFPTCAVIHDAVFAGSAEALERARQARAVDRPELSAALAALGDTGAELVLIPGADTRRVLEEMVPNLPKEIGGGPITIVSKGLAWTAAGLTPEPEPRVQVLVQGKDAGSAQALGELGKSVLSYLGSAPQTSRLAPDFAKLANDLKTEVNGDRITISVNPAKVRTWADVMIGPMLESARRRQCVDNLKQVGLAMHNYLSAHRTFPPSYVADASGKPLLSWRVLLLPYLEANDVYKEFRLNEPWDSEHNRALIAKMPAVYRCPGSRLKAKGADAGKTCYLVPRGKSTIFPGTQGVAIRDITDGTSNTILVVEASDAMAVEWTRPDDWETGPGTIINPLIGHHSGGTNFTFADGSVRFLKDTVDPSVFRILLTRDGGEVVSSDGF